MRGLAAHGMDGPDPCPECHPIGLFSGPGGDVQADLVLPEVHHLDGYHDGEPSGLPLVS